MYVPSASTMLAGLVAVAGLALAHSTPHPTTITGPPATTPALPPGTVFEVAIAVKGYKTSSWQVVAFNREHLCSGPHVKLADGSANPCDKPFLLPGERPETRGPWQLMGCSKKDTELYMHYGGRYFGGCARNERPAIGHACDDYRHSFTCRKMDWAPNAA
jgi:hypothetical protein